MIEGKATGPITQHDSCSHLTSPAIVKCVCTSVFVLVCTPVSLQDVHLAPSVCLQCWRKTFRLALNQLHMVPSCKY